MNGRRAYKARCEFISNTKRELNKQSERETVVKVLKIKLLGHGLAQYVFCVLITKAEKTTISRLTLSSRSEKLLPR